MSATGADAFSRRKTQSKVYWSTIPKNKRDELQAAAAAAGTTVQINEDGTAVVQTAATGALLLAPARVHSSLSNSSTQAKTVMHVFDGALQCSVQHHVCSFRVRKVQIHIADIHIQIFESMCVQKGMRSSLISIVSFESATK